MVWKAVVALSLALASNPVQAEDVLDPTTTGNAFLTACQDGVRSEPIYLGMCLGLVAGILERDHMFAPSTIICIPNGVTNGQRFDIVIKFIREHPDTRHFNASLLAFVALKQAFPCPPK